MGEDRSRIRSNPGVFARLRSFAFNILNLGSHKGHRARRAIRRAGAHLLFLPPCGPDLNPIEQFFAKLKHLMRAAEQRTVETTWRKVGAILGLVSPTECANYLANSGYASV